MYRPKSYPSFVYYFDGFSEIVHQPEDLQPGCAQFPTGPFPEMAQGWRWKISHDEGFYGGPFAPDKTKYRYVRGLPFEALVYAVEPRVVNGVQRDTYEVWSRGSSEVEHGLKLGVLAVVPPGAQLSIFDKTGRCFLDEDARDAAARRYAARDLTGFERAAPAWPDIAPAPELSGPCSVPAPWGRGDGPFALERERQGPFYYVCGRVPVDFAYDGALLDHGEIFPLGGHLNDTLLTKLSYIAPVPPYAHVVVCAVCRHQFIDEQTGSRHALQRHGSEALVVLTVHDLSLETLVAPAMEGTLGGPSVSAQSRPTRHRGRPKGTTTHKRQTLPGQLKKVYWNYYDEHGEVPRSMAIVAQLLIPSIDERTLRNYLELWPEIQYPPPR